MPRERLPKVDLFTRLPKERAPETNRAVGDDEGQQARLDRFWAKEAEPEIGVDFEAALVDFEADFNNDTAEADDTDFDGDVDDGGLEAELSEADRGWNDVEAEFTAPEGVGINVPEAPVVTTDNPTASFVAQQEAEPSPLDRAADLPELAPLPEPEPLPPLDPLGELADPYGSAPLDPGPLGPGAPGGPLGP